MLGIVAQLGSGEAAETATRVGVLATLERTRSVQSVKAKVAATFNYAAEILMLSGWKGLRNSV